MNNYHLMCRLTCSRCWRVLMGLNECQVNAKPRAETVILAPGNGRYLAAAQQLAAKLDLPICFVPVGKVVRGTLNTVWN